MGATVGDTTRIAIRVPQSLRKLIDRYLAEDIPYVSLSEFARAALRQKIMREAPWIYEEVLRAKDQNPGGHLQCQTHVCSTVEQNLGREGSR